MNSEKSLGVDPSFSGLLNQPVATDNYFRHLRRTFRQTTCETWIEPFKNKNQLNSSFLNMLSKVFQFLRNLRSTIARKPESAVAVGRTCSLD